MLIESLYKEELGFSIIIKKLAEKKVPLAGSNSMMSLCFMYQQFFKKMPESYLEFVKSFNSYDFLGQQCFDSKLI